MVAQYSREPSTPLILLRPPCQHMRMLSRLDEMHYYNNYSYPPRFSICITHYCITEKGLAAVSNRTSLGHIQTYCIYWTSLFSISPLTKGEEFKTPDIGGSLASNLFPIIGLEAYNLLSLRRHLSSLSFSFCHLVVKPSCAPPPRHY